MERDELRQVLNAAVYKTTRQGELKAKPLANVLDVPHQQFLNKTCFTKPDLTLNLYEAVESELVSGKRHIFKAVCEILGEQAIPARVEELTEGGLITALLKVSTAIGNCDRFIDDALSNDRKIDKDELQGCKAATHEIMKAVLRLELELEKAEKNETVFAE